MKKFVLFLVIISSTILSLFSCSEESFVEDKSHSSNFYTSNLRSEEEITIDTLFVVSESKNGMISFVNEVKRYYDSGMTYNDLKNALDPDSGLVNITSIGDELLSEAYYNIVNDVRDEDMNGVKIMEALESIIQYNFENGVVRMEDIDLEAGELWLFGIDENSQILNRGGCRWYQIGCHLNSIWNWLSTPASGGGATNGATLAAVVGVVASVITIISAFSGD